MISFVFKTFSRICLLSVLSLVDLLWVYSARCYWHLVYHHWSWWDRPLVTVLWGWTAKRFSKCILIYICGWSPVLPRFKALMDKSNHITLMFLQSTCDQCVILLTQKHPCSACLYECKHYLWIVFPGALWPRVPPPVRWVSDHQQFSRRHHSDLGLPERLDQRPVRGTVSLPHLHLHF